jgi:hypothetical protein
MERFNLRKLNKIESKEQYQVDNSNRSAALENLNDDVDIDRAWETVGECQNFNQRECRLLGTE